MVKQSILAAVAIFIVWSILDLVIHGLLLANVYAATGPELFRPMTEFKMTLMRVVVFISAATFVAIYTLVVADKRLTTGLLYGALYGVGVGIGMGYGTYAAMPIPYTAALAWFLGSIVRTSLAGLLVGAIVRPSRQEK
jgi:hypothetical protein